MKILLINKFHYRKGGSETYYFALGEALKTMGHQVIYFSMEDKKNLPCSQEKFFVSNVDYNDTKQGFLTKIKSGLKIIYSFEARKKIRKLLKQEKPDIAHIGLLHRHITFSVVDELKKQNIPIVMSMHDLIFACPCYMMLANNKICQECAEKGLRCCIKKSCVKNSKVKSTLAVLEAKFLKWGRYYNKIDLYIAECEFYKKMMVESRFTTSRIIKMTNFLPVQQKYEWNPDYEEYILYFGRFSEEKGILTLLEAYTKLHCDNTLVIVGEGPLRKNIEEYIKEHCMQNVKLQGATYGEEMECIIEKAKVIVVPSQWYENCPYVVMQAMAKGKVVLASRIGGLPELIEDGRTGYVFEAGNSDSLAKNLNKVLALPRDEYEELSMAILEAAKKKYDWKDYIESLLATYQELITGSRSLNKEDS